jgi:hypothetical protein
MNRRRLEAEAIRDSVLAAGGRIEERRGGPADADLASRRRMLYLRSSRSDRSGFGSLFDAADASIHVDKRTVSTVAPQALFLMNDAWVLGAARRLASRPEVVSEEQPEQRIQALYRLVYGRDASAEEVAVGRRFAEAAASEARPDKPQDSAPLGPWEAYAQALLLSNEFLFVD